MRILPSADALEAHMLAAFICRHAPGFAIVAKRKFHFVGKETGNGAFQQSAFLPPAAASGRGRLGFRGSATERLRWPTHSRSDAQTDAAQLRTIKETGGSHDSLVEGRVFEPAVSSD